MSKKVQISESVLRQMIVRALNESMFEAGGNQHNAIEAWARAVRNGADPLRCREFGPFYMSLVNDYRCMDAVKLGVGQESTFQSGDENAERKPPIKVDELFRASRVGEDIIQDFFIGEDCIVRDSSKPDSFKGDNVVACVDIFLNNGENEFFTYLCRLLNTYARHYCRKHYNEWVMQYGKGATQIGGDKSSHVEDQYTGQEIDNEDPMEYDTASLTGNNENKYFEKMASLVERILSDGSIGLGPQERNLLQCLLDIANTPLDPQRLERMQSLSPTQQNQEIYQEMSERTGIEVDKIKRSLSAAIQKAKQSKYAKMLEEKKKQIAQKILNEVMNKILNK